jgi:hypothetical protein
MQISANRVGKAIKNLIKAVESNPKNALSTLCAPNSLTETKATVSIDVIIEKADRTNK